MNPAIVRVTNDLAQLAFPANGKETVQGLSPVPVAPDERIGMCVHSHVPVLEKAENGSGLNTEMLFGERFKILGHVAAGNFTHVKLLANGEEGFIDVPFARIPTEVHLAGADPGVVLRDTIGVLIGPKARVLQIPAGSTLPAFDRENGTVRIQTDSGFLEFHLHSGSVDTFAGRSLREQFVGMALLQEGAPFAWGRRGFAFDCSGEQVSAGTAIGLMLPHGSNAMFKLLPPAQGIETAETGDFLFYSSREGGRVRHVGTFLRNQDGTTEILHASGEVKRQPVGPDGEYNPAADRKLAGVGRLVSSGE